MDCPEERPSPEQSARLDALAKSMRKTLAEIYELADPRATTPTQDMQQIRIKSSVALRTAAQMGLVS